MRAVETSPNTLVRVATLSELEPTGRKVVSAGGRTILLVQDDGEVFALDNRCPHMGFPLHKGTIEDGVLTCHWHHARFDLRGGCTLDPFADDVPSFPVEVRDGEVFVDPKPRRKDPRAHWSAKLEEGLEQNIRLVLAKSVIELEKTGAAGDVVRTAALFGVKNRREGWSAGLSILTAMANVLPDLDPKDRALALFHGLVHVARATDGQAPDFALDPLDTTETRPERYVSWFRRFIETRSGSAAERVLRAALRNGLPRETIANMIFGASTDHLYLDEGHVLDFANKAFELLDRIGWEHAEAVLPSLIPSLASGERMEETSAWRHPVDLPRLLSEVHKELDAWIAEGNGKLKNWNEHAALADVVLDGEPVAILGAIRDALRKGAPLAELSSAVAYAASRRLAHFHVSNEFDDWNTVHHAFTYANAVDQAVRRSPSSLLARGIFDAAMAVYLVRFLNVPKQAIPVPAGKSVSLEALAAEFDRQGRVDETASAVAELLKAGKHEEVIRLLGHLLLREDAGFHLFQSYEASLRQYRRFAGRPEGDHVLLGTARFLTAHAPTVRAMGQTFDIATRLQRGDALHEEA